MKKTFALILAIALLLTGCAPAVAPAPGNEAEEATQQSAPPAGQETVAGDTATQPASPPVPAPVIRVAGLKGPTTMGLIRLAPQEGNASLPENAGFEMQFELFGAADEITTKLVKGELDAAAIPCNLASVLYNKTEGALKVAAINTLGVLYIVENGDTVHDIQDLRGKTLVSTGKGTTPEYALNHVLRANGIDPEKDLTIEYKTEAAEAAAMLMEAGNEGVVAMLPQPYVTTVQMKNQQIRTALDLTAEWDKAAKDGSALVTGVLVVRKDCLQANEEAFDDFMDAYEDSVEWVNANNAEAAELIAGLGIVPSAAVAQKALPQCNITFIDGDEMKAKVSGYLQTLFGQDPKAVGGAMPGDDFYYDD